MLTHETPIRGESATDFHRFCLYRDLGPRRSLSEAARRCGISLSRTKQLSTEYRWSQRASIGDMLSGRERRARQLRKVVASREALLHEASELQQWVRAAVAQWVRRGPEGRPELTQALSFGQAFAVWQAALEIEQRLVRYAPPQESSGNPASGRDDDRIRISDLLVDEVQRQLVGLGVSPARIGEFEYLIVKVYLSDLLYPSAEPGRPEDAQPDETARDPE